MLLAYRNVAGLKRSTVVAAVTAAAGLAVGLAAEKALYGLADTRSWIPDAVAGWSLLGAAVAVRRRTRIALVFAAAGAAWFLANFLAAGPLLYLYVGVLIHLAFTYPDGIVRGRLQTSAVAIGYGLALVRPVWESPAAVISVAISVVVIASFEALRACGPVRRLRFAACEASAGLSGILLVVAALHLGGVRASALLFEQLGIAVYAALLVVGLLAEPWSTSSVADLVVRLSEDRSGLITAQLGRVLGDPRLEVGFWEPSTGRYLDSRGEELDPTVALAGRVATRFEVNGEPAAVVLHGQATFDHPGVAAAVSAAIELGGEYASLQAEIQSWQAKVSASRRRLIDAGDEEQSQLERTLRDGPERRLRVLRSKLADARRGAYAGEVAGRLKVAETRAEQALDDLRRVSRGLRPRELREGGLVDALVTLADASPVQVVVRADAERLPEPDESTFYFVAMEALANSVKHARASTVRIDLTVDDDRVRLVVADDGVGGADVAGSGLRGLADRIEARGGRLVVDSPRGQGTCLIAETPRGGARAGARDGARATRT